ncbi:uncharacterized protein LOC144582522 isoform X3 [Callithrix jacchus]
MPAVSKRDGMRSLAVFIWDICNCAEGRHPGREVRSGLHLALQAPVCHENLVKVGGYILGEFGNLRAGDPGSRLLCAERLLLWSGAWPSTPILTSSCSFLTSRGWETEAAFPGSIAAASKCGLGSTSKHTQVRQGGGMGRHILTALNCVLPPSRVTGMWKCLKHVPVSGLELPSGADRSSLHPAKIVVLQWCP